MITQTIPEKLILWLVRNLLDLGKGTKFNALLSTIIFERDGKFDLQLSFHCGSTHCVSTSVSENILRIAGLFRNKLATHAKVQKSGLKRNGL